MNSNGFNQNQACSENNEFDFNQFTFNYDWDNDSECDISDEILSEDCISGQIKINSPCSMKVNRSRFNSNNTTNKISKSKFCKSDEFNGKRISRKINATIKDKSRAIDEESSLLDDVKSTDFNSKLAKHDLCKPLNMKDQIRELLRQLVIENKKKVEYENSKILERAYDIPHFVTMKDIKIVEDS